VRAVAFAALSLLRRGWRHETANRYRPQAFPAPLQAAAPAAAHGAALLQSVEYPANVGSIFRLADGAGLAELVLSGITPTPPHPTVEKVARYKTAACPGATRKIRWSPSGRCAEQGFQIVAVELADGAVPYHRYDYLRKPASSSVTKITASPAPLSRLRRRRLPADVRQGPLAQRTRVALSIVVYHVLHAPG
jgi:hypothetical protein